MNTHKPALVGNAADQEQVARAKRSEKFARESQLNRYREVLGEASPVGYSARQMLWEWLGHFGVHASIFVTSSEIYYRAGKQDSGHYLMAEIVAADPEIYLLMQAEAIQRDRKVVEPETKDTENNA